ncbi:MAG: S9 family peptidase, partial [Halieaceae bacterium]|nr:S9 family peptidase [Halieaceae bacterium]
RPASVGLAGQQPVDITRYLLARGVLGASIAPDGKTVAFSDRVTGEPQLWTVNASGGWATQLSFGSGISDFHWKPDGTGLLITRDTDGDEREGYYLLTADGTQESEVLPASDAYRSFGMFSADGEQFIYASTERNGRDFDLYVYDFRDQSSRRIYEANFGFFAQAWQPGGALVLVDETRGEDANDVHLLNVDTGVMTPLFTPDVAAYHGSYQWTPDGRGFYMASNQDRDRAALAFYDLASGQLRYLETPSGVVEEVALSHDGRYLAWVVNNEGVSQLAVRDLKDNRDITVPTMPRGVLRISFARSANALQLTVRAPKIPGDVLVWNLEKNDIKRAFRSNLAGINPAVLVEPESLRYPARDGELLHGFLYRPKVTSPGTSAPVVVRVHGGPTSQARPVYRAQTQYLVNKGVAVFDVNVRGSTGFGKRFSRLDNQEKRLDSVRDLVDTVDFLSTQPGIDTERAGVMGGSYGGYMVNAVLGEYPDVFAVGASFVGVSNWVRALEEASPGLKASDRIEYGDIREQKWKDFYLDNSPINNAHRIKVPLFVEHGVNDPRDPVQESDSIVRTVRDGGGEVTYLRFPDEGHGIAKQENLVTFNRQLSEFLERHLLERDSLDSNKPEAQ